MIVPVILSGGSGTRLWPLSTPARPKQFLPLVTDKTLFQETLIRLDGLPDLASPIVVCNAAHRLLVADQLAEIGVKPAAVVLEPAGRNTAPAIAVAAMLAGGSDVADGGPAGSSDPVLLVLPADHVIADGDAFRAAVVSAARAARAGHLVTFGIVPTRPETGYGYIEQGDVAGDWSTVVRFVEKPDIETATRYVGSGRFLWNSGMFAFGAAAYLEELRRLVPEIATACDRAVEGTRYDEGFAWLGGEFLGSPSDSIDYAVMEKTGKAAVVPLDAGWSDVGSWSALCEVLPKDADGNALRGNIVAQDTSDSLVVAEARRIALIGLRDVVVVEAGDSLLIMARERSQDVKALQQEIEPEDG